MDNSNSDLNEWSNNSLAMAEMQLLVATIYNKYHTKISPRTKAADTELDDQVTLSGPLVTLFLLSANPLVSELLD